MCILKVYILDILIITFTTYTPDRSSNLINSWAFRRNIIIVIINVTLHTIIIININILKLLHVSVLCQIRIFIKDVEKYVHANSAASLPIHSL